MVLWSPSPGRSLSGSWIVRSLWFCGTPVLQEKFHGMAWTFGPVRAVPLRISFPIYRLHYILQVQQIDLLFYIFETEPDVVIFFMLL